MIRSLSPKEIIEHRNAERVIAIYKAIFFLHLVLILTVDTYNYFSGIWETDKGQYYVFLNRLFTMPLVMITKKMNESYLKHKWTSHDMMIVLNAILVAPYIWSYYSIEMYFYRDPAPMLIYIGSFCVITRLPQKKMMVLTIYFFLLYYGILLLQGVSYREYASLYVHGITMIFIFHRVAVKLYNNDLADVQREILLLKKGEELDTLNTQLQEANQEVRLKNMKLNRSNNKLGNFAYIAAHDLKSPLGTISSFVSLLEDKYKDTKEYVEDQQIFKFITSACTDLQNIIDNLLNFSKISDEENEVFDKVALDALTTRCKELLSEKIAQRNATINVATQIPEVYGKKPLLKQLFMNLISNAIKFSKKGIAPVVDIDYKIDQEQERVEISIKDNGIGIPKKHQEEIFQLFKKLNSSAEYEGTGIGLATCKKIVEKHGGDIFVESMEGIGSVFKFTLPLKQ